MKGDRADRCIARHGGESVGYLVVPRMLSCMLMIPLLTVFGDVIGVAGGWVIATQYSSISSFLYLDSIDNFVDLHDITGGLIKAAVFGIVLALLGCYYGLHAPDGAEEVGKATTPLCCGTSLLFLCSMSFCRSCFIDEVMM